MKYIIAALIILAPCASASIVISQVLADPLNTESGGEALELRNDGSSPVDIGGWVIKTESSATDATIPKNTVLKPSDTFLIADEGWNSSKDNSSWKAADYEEKITLGNKNGGVALLDVNGTTVDAVGWGDPDEIDAGLVEGDPAATPKAGQALRRINETDDNAVDFKADMPSFYTGLFVPITASVSFGSGTSTGQYLVVSKSLTLDPTGTLTIKNHASSKVDIAIVIDDLHSASGIITKDHLKLESATFTMQGSEEKNVDISLDIPEDAVPGTYTSSLRIQYVFQ